MNESFIKKKHKVLKIILFVFGALIALLLIQINEAIRLQKASLTE